MGKALYRKYRPKALHELIGQEHVTKTLEQAIASGKISHAYLFTGPRGIGKTSVARILAHQINGIDYVDDSAHIDIIEIDAASNRRIDEIREIRETVYIAPTQLKYKVYIIDEVHMLTKEAFNALLKTLEEPPAHVVFMLATTDAHKLPETIISRTQRYSFRPVATQLVADHLKTIAAAENIAISDGALTLLAEHGEGSLRDSISILDQASSLVSTDDGQIGKATVATLLGLAPAASVTALCSSVLNHSEPHVIMRQIADLLDGGYPAEKLSVQLSKELRDSILLASSPTEYDSILHLLQQLLQVPAAYDVPSALQLALLGAVRIKEIKTTQTKNSVVAAPPVAKPMVTKRTLLSQQPAKQKQISTKPEAEQPIPASQEAQDDWQNILAALRTKHNTLYSLVRMAQPDFTKKGDLCLSFAHDFHRKRLLEMPNQTKLNDIIEQVTGKRLSITCLLDKNLGDAVPAQKTGQSVNAEPAITPELVTISNIFGGAELVE